MIGYYLHELLVNDSVKMRPKFKQKYYQTTQQC